MIPPPPHDLMDFRQLYIDTSHDQGGRKKCKENMKEEFEDTKGGNQNPYIEEQTT